MSAREDFWAGIEVETAALLQEFDYRQGLALFLVFLWLIAFVSLGPLLVAIVFEGSWFALACFAVAWPYFFWVVRGCT